MNIVIKHQIFEESGKICYARICNRLGKSMDRKYYSLSSSGANHLKFCYQADLLICELMESEKIDKRQARDHFKQLQKYGLINFCDWYDLPDRWVFRGFKHKP